MTEEISNKTLVDNALKADPVKVALAGMLSGAGYELGMSITRMPSFRKEEWRMLAESTALCSVQFGVAAFLFSHLYNHHVGQKISFAEKEIKKALANAGEYKGNSIG